jgi:NAD(P)-dependent dehydrogenase (short-subunit alcohol dehydrogenase family)
MTGTSAADPRDEHRTEGFPPQGQDQPATLDETTPGPDHGETSYVGHGRLAGRKALVTGGDSGIGRAVAIAFAREGADVAIVHLPEEQEDADGTVQLIHEAGRAGLSLAGDLRDEDFASSIVDRTIEAFGGIDLLVLNAAYQKDRNGIAELETEEFDRVLRTNLYAMMFTARAAVPHLAAGATITVTSSIQAFQPSPGLIDYAMTKAAQVAFVRALAEELGPQGIRVNAVAPGPVWTPLIPGTGWDEDKLASFGQDTPLGRAAQPAELAGAYVYLASGDASYVSGAVLPVTGGKPL